MGRLSVLVASNMSIRMPECRHPAVAAGLHARQSMSRSRPVHPRQNGVIGFMTTSLEAKETPKQQQLPCPSVETMKQKLMSTRSFRQFQGAIQRSPALLDDWLSFTSRPWVQGPVDAFFGNPHLAAMMKDNKELEDTVDRIITTGDAVLQQGNHVPWLVHVIKTVAGHSGIYILIESLEEMLGPHRIARLEAITDAALTRPRAVKIVAVLSALMTPQMLDDLMRLLQAFFTDDRLLRLMDAAEYVVSDEDRLALADLALDQLSDAVPDDGILHMIASIDAAADVSLLLQTGQELLAWLLADPEQMGEGIGEFVDEVVDMKRLEAAVARNDEVMTLERISIMGKVLAQLSPAMKADNISAATEWMHNALTSHELQAWTGELSANISAQDVRTWWRSFDCALSTDVVFALLHLVESLLDGGRIWALMGQPQPMLEMLLLADEEARAATCRSSCGSHSRDSPMHSMDGGSTSSRDGWNRTPLPASEDNTNKTLAEAAAAAAAAAATAAAAAASVAPSCEIGDKSCQACSGACGSPVERMFASGAALSDPDLQELIRHYLAVCRQPRRQEQRRVAEQAAQIAMAAGAATSGSASSGPAASVSSLSSYWEVNGQSLRSFLVADDAEIETALESAAAAAAAAAAVAAAAAASNSTSCHFNSPGSSTQGANSSSRTTDAAPATALSSQATQQQQQLRQHVVQGAVAASRAVLRPKQMQQLLGLLPELFAPQRVAVALAVLDSKLRIGEHEIALGPTCELQNSTHSKGSNQDVQLPSAATNTTESSGSSSSSNADGSLSPLVQVLLSLRSMVLQSLLDSAVAAAAETAAAPASKQQLLHAVDTVLAILTVQEYGKTQQQQQASTATAATAAQAHSSNVFTQASAAVTAALHAAQMAVSHPDTGVLGIPAVAAAAAAAAGPSSTLTGEASTGASFNKPGSAHSATAVLGCALGDPHSCVQLDNSTASEGSSSRGSDRSGRQADLLATMIGLHVALLGDACKLWWAYHTTLVMQMFTKPFSEETTKAVSLV